MTPDALARLHRRSIRTPRPWSAKEFESLLGLPGVFLTGDPQSFALGRVIAGEAELLTLVVDPQERRQGRGRACLAAYEAEALLRGAQRSFLDVAEDNAAAIALYSALGYTECGRRKAYYQTETGAGRDALTLSRRLLQP